MNAYHTMRTSAGILVLMGWLLTLVVSACYLLHPPFVEYLIDRSTDAVMASGSPRSPSGSVMVVDIDRASLAKYGQWPWSRYRLARLLEKIQTGGAQSIGLDMILAEPDRTSPAMWRSTLKDELGYDVDLGNIPERLLDFDAILAETLSKGPFVLAFKFLFNDAGRKPSACHLHPLSIAWVQKDGPDRFRERLFEPKGVDCSLPGFSSVVSRLGFLNATPDSDGLLRRMPLLMKFDDQVFPCFALATLMQAKGTSQLAIRTQDGGQCYVLLEGMPIPVDRKGNILLNISLPAGELARISAADVLDDRAPGDAFRDKIVLVGSSASGLENVYQTPGAPIFSEVEIHAQLVESLLSKRFIWRNRTVVFWEIALAFFLATACSLSIARFDVFPNTIIGCVLIFGVWQASSILFNNGGVLFSPLLPSTVVFLTYTVLTIYKYWRKDVGARREINDMVLSLKESEAKLQSIIMTIPDIVFRLDASGRIIFISPAIEKYGHHPDGLIGEPLLDFVAPEDRGPATDRINERRTGPRATTELELRLLLTLDREAHDDAFRYFSVSAQGIYETNQAGEKIFLGTQGIIKDITEQKQLQNQLLQAKKMEAIGNLAAGVAHDLNNVLSGLVSYPELLLMDLPRENPLRRSLQTIHKSGQKAADIVKDLLTLSRRGVAISEIFNVNEVISDYLSSPEFGQLKKNHNNIRVETDLQSGLFNIKGSPLHLAKTIMNVVANAAEAMPAGGRIVLRTGNRYLDTGRTAHEAIPEGEYVLLSVEDEGIGISEEDLKHIFEPFYTKKRMGRSGTGLGMTVVWATVKDHGGYVDVQSTEGEGTRLDIYLPITRDLSAEKNGRVALEDYLGTETVLVVDDIAEQREIAEKMLGKLGYEVKSVSSGEAAVAYLSTHTTDLVVLDMIMPPGIDGLETYRRIRDIHPGQKAIIASGFTESDLVKSLRELGVGAYVAKPYTLEKIGLAVRRELDRR